jgi:hypothetical protein
MCVCVCLLLHLMLHVRAELLQELAKKEREQGIYPDPEVDLFMKVCARLIVRWNTLLTHTYAV